MCCAALLPGWCDSKRSSSYSNTTCDTHAHVHVQVQVAMPRVTAHSGCAAGVVRVQLLPLVCRAVYGLCAGLSTRVLLSLGQVPVRG